MTANQKVSKLRSLVEQAIEQQSKQDRDTSFTIWHDRLINSLITIFSADSHQVNRISQLTFTYSRKIRATGVDYSVADRERRQAAFKRDLELAIGLLKNYIEDVEELEGDTSQPPTQTSTLPSLASLHPAIQQAAGSLYATGHYRQALLDAYITVDTAVREKSQLTGSGTRLMEVAFSPGNPVLKIGDSSDEQQGFMALFRGAMLAVRNPKAHSLNGTHDAQRALEWLSFASVLLRNLDDAVLAQPTATPPTL